MAKSTDKTGPATNLPTLTATLQINITPHEALQIIANHINTHYTKIQTNITADQVRFVYDEHGENVVGITAELNI